MLRRDLNGRTAPRWLQAIVTRQFGLTPFGEPRYRLVWAPSRFERSGGIWVDWDPAIAAAARQAGTAAPLRRVPEMRWVRKYPGEKCWLLERWVPAANYGSPESWYAPLSQGGTLLWHGCGSIPACGDYPQFGDYEDIGARMHWYPTEHHVVTAIAAVERNREQMPPTAAGRAARRTWNAQLEQEKRDREFDRAAMDLFDDAGFAFGGAPHIGYGGSHRPALVEMAERIGIRQHPL